MNSQGSIFADLNLRQTYRDLPENFYQDIAPQPLKEAHLISFNPSVANWLGLDACRVNPSDLARYFGGDGILPDSQPLAMKYAGHQFGVYNPQLGDGRGMLLGELVNRDGQRIDLHLKGAGKTAYSRFGDGRAVLRSSIREYLVSEAMYALGIPTTRALSLVGSEEFVMRNGMEPCAAVLRVTECHIRFGHFEHLYYTRQHDALRELADYCIARYYPQFQNEEDPYLAFFIEIRNRSAKLVAQWQAYGFVHGVLNTDNMSILGETFDYGPFTFLDEYDPTFVSNKNDHEGRYAFENQPDIVLWNLSCLAQALLPLSEKDALVSALNEYRDIYFAAYYGLMRKRLGLLLEKEGDADLINQLILMAQAQKADLTRFLRDLCDIAVESPATIESCMQHFASRDAIEEWLTRYLARVALEAASQPIRKQQMRSVNPAYLLRNYMLEEAIREAHQGDYRPVNTLLGIIRKPFETQTGAERFGEAPPDWAASICLTCSS
ncbi:protein adenylyltransferase SelO [Neptunomonas sp. XY-337]|uniref:protein adenylyltransferase SelO n=1 Tax=Neptunomonas sp. XY-337 TaxID=2561897 RepID=UPI0010AA6306|nr:YdiU family protein [Neptunomonas sp. XY-337]